MGSQPTPGALTTTGVTITVTVDTTTAGPPYYAKAVTGFATRSDGSTVDIGGFGVEDLGVIQQNGADFTLLAEDAGWGQNQTQVTGWALGFLPRQSNGPVAPMGNGLTSNNAVITTTAGAFTLISPNGNGNGNGGNALKNAGNTNRDWDWALMVRLQSSDGSVKVFVSDPEMQMDTEG